jgi:hypothetical protein
MSKENKEALIKVIAENFAIIRDQLKEFKFNPSYSRKRLEAAKEEQLLEAIEFLNESVKLFRAYTKIVPFPGVKSFDEYKILGLSKTKEQLDKENAKKAFITHWKSRSNLLRKPHAGQQNTNPKPAA